ncbi:hypothetical protein ACPESR_24715 [Nocardia testacea]|uniref:hypothetical protein n=1 Tax=Nocardia testacea TaxID=248551 RepID=UPI003C2ED411
MIEELEVCASPVLAPGSVYLGQLTLLVGLHGAGKSYLLSVLAAGLPGWQSISNRPIDSAGHSGELSGVYRLTMIRENVRQEYEYKRPNGWRRQTFDEPVASLVVTTLTTERAMWDLGIISQEFPNIDTANLVGVTRATKKERDALRDITGHEYSQLEYGRIVGFEENMPFTKGTRNSRVVDTWTMSDSEIWVHYVLKSLRDAGPNEVVLIDEPESFLAQPGHRAFIDEIARLTLASGCQTIIATHSDTMVRRVPASLIRQLTQGRDGTLVTEVQQAEGILRVLGRGGHPVSTLVFAEDELASKLIHAILSRYAPEKLDMFDLVDSGGKDEAIRGASIVNRSKRFTAVAVLDADQKNTGRVRGVLYLPGRSDPEKELLDSLAACDLDAAERLRVSVAEFRIALDATRFVSHQRVFAAIAGALPGCSSEAIRDTAIGLWIQNGEVEESMRGLVEELLAIAAGLP